MRISAFALPVLGSVALSMVFAQSAGPSAVADWVRSNAIPLKTVEASNGFDDLAPLRSIIGDARVVELGEATHGSREFFQLKHRILEYLATNLGFTIFTIEASMPEAYRLNDYVLTGKGDPAQLIRGMGFWTWDTEEVLAMVEWMREFNRSGKGTIQFTGFDMQNPRLAGEIVSRFVDGTDPDFASVVRPAVLNANNAPATPAGAGFGLLTSTFPIDLARGKRIRYSGAIKTSEVQGGYGGLWWRVDGKNGVLSLNNMQSEGPAGTKGWERYAMEVEVPVDATNINFGVLHPGIGTAWFDDLKIEVDGEEFKGWPFDPTFEKAPNAYTGGAGYNVVLDTTEKMSGERSLRMTFVGAPRPTGPSLGDLAKTWADIADHLQGNRAAYKAAGRSEAEIDWAIQNATIVKQCMQMRNQLVPRDQSMARNIRWILDHNPTAKIVVWAHNGHVAVSGSGDNRSMGAFLREALGKQMVSFGFAFNQGSFQSIEPGSKLREFTLPPAPKDTLDAALTEAGIPLFALSLQNTATAPAGVREWWADAHRARSIGAAYSEGQSEAYFIKQILPATYDALLFVDKTTRARSLPGAQGR